MPIGNKYPAEGAVETDRQTGRLVRQVTSAPAIHHHPFFYIPAFDRAGEKLFFVSHRTGSPQIFFEEGPGGPLVQVTERTDLNEWSLHPSTDGRHVYYTAGNSAFRTDLVAMKEQRLHDFGDKPVRAAGFVGAAMGTTTLSADDRWWAISVKTGAGFTLYVLDTETGAADAILERETIAHPQFHPDDSTSLRYAGPHTARLWIISRDGSDHRMVYERDAARREWIVHETWRPGSREILAASWPHGVVAVDVDTGRRRWASRAPAWHPMVSRDGRWIVADTNYPDVGLLLLPTDTAGGPVETLCYPQASSVGAHWHHDHCPYDDGPVEVYAPQHTHPHPSFSPDGRRVVFTSDKSGFAQVYEVEIEARCF